MNLVITLGVFLAMEGATWIIHKYVMHGFLWGLHKDHHDHSSEGALEKNDYFFVIFALPTIALIYFGSLEDFNYLFYIGLGIMLYGMAYFFVHDIFIHQRLPLFTHTKNPYFLALRRAHKQHHKHLGKEDGECFDIQRYLGTWYEIARFDFRFEKDLDNVSAQYGLNEKGNVLVLNSGHNYIKEEWKKAEGLAKFRGKKDRAELKVLTHLS